MMISGEQRELETLDRYENVIMAYDYDRARWFYYVRRPDGRPRAYYKNGHYVIDHNFAGLLYYDPRRKQWIRP